MAARDIQKQFRGLRADTGRRKGRPDPFATGFEDDSDEDSRQRRSRSKTKQAPASVDKSLDSTKNTLNPKLPPARESIRDEEDAFLDPPKRSDRHPSPAPAALPLSRVTDAGTRGGSLPDISLPSKGLQGKAIQVNRPARNSRAQAAGTLALLDDSESEEELPLRPVRSDRYPSPAPRKQSDPVNPQQRSSTPRGTREGSADLVQSAVQPPRHTVASPFAGTKYLQDSDSDGDDGAPASRNNSIEEALTDSGSASPEQAKAEVKRVDKPKTQHGGGVSWRAFSEGREQQRTQEIDALQTSLKQRGKSISFGSHALTDDGKRIPVHPSPEQIFAGARGPRKGSRGKSPPRRDKDTEPTEDEVADGSGLGIYDPTQFKTNPFTGQPVRRTFSDPDTNANNRQNGNRLPATADAVPGIRIHSVAQQ